MLKDDDYHSKNFNNGGGGPNMINNEAVPPSKRKVLLGDTPANERSHSSSAGNVPYAPPMHRG